MADSVMNLTAFDFRHFAKLQVVSGILTFNLTDKIHLYFIDKIEFKNQ